MRTNAGTRCNHCGVVPQGLSYLGAAVDCFSKLQGKSQRLGWMYGNYEEAFRECNGCESFHQRLHWLRCHQESSLLYPLSSTKVLWYLARVRIRDYAKSFHGNQIVQTFCRFLKAIRQPIHIIGFSFMYYRPLPTTVSTVQVREIVDLICKTFLDWSHKLVSFNRIRINLDHCHLLIKILFAKGCQWYSLTWHVFLIKRASSLSMTLKLPSHSSWSWVTSGRKKLYASTGTWAILKRKKKKKILIRVHENLYQH